MPESLEDKVYEYRRASWAARQGFPMGGRATEAERINIAKLRDAYDTAESARNSGLTSRSLAAEMEADKWAWDMAVKLSEGADSVTKSRVTASATMANKTLDQMGDYTPSDKSIHIANKILANDASPGWVEKATDDVLHENIVDQMLNVSPPLSAADWNGTIGRVAWNLSIKPSDLREAMAEKDTNQAFLRVWDQRDAQHKASSEYSRLVGNYVDNMKGARGWGGNANKLISDYKKLKAARGGEDRARIEESYESISSIPTGEITTRQEILDEQNPEKLYRSLIADPRYREQMADYGYRNAEEFYRDFYHNKGRTLKERRPLPPPGAALTSGALEGGSPDERRAIEQGISDEDLAADLQKADIGRSQARTAQQADAEREWEEDFKKTQSNPPPHLVAALEDADRKGDAKAEALAKRAYFTWQMDELRRMQDAMHRELDPLSDFRKEWDEKIDGWLEATELRIKNIDEGDVDKQRLEERGGPIQLDGLDVPLAESDDARRRAVGESLRIRHPEGRSTTEIAEALQERLLEDEVAGLPLPEEPAAPPPEPGLPAAPPVERPDAAITVNPASEDRSADRARAVRAAALGLSPKEMDALERVKKANADREAATTAWGRIQRGIEGEEGL